MTYILVINAGSSSLKYQLIDIDTESVIAKGICERIGIAGSQLTYSPADGEKVVRQQDMRNHEDAISLVLDILSDKEVGVIKDMSSIAAVGGAANAIHQTGVDETIHQRGDIRLGNVKIFRNFRHRHGAALFKQGEHLEMGKRQPMLALKSRDMRQSLL